MKPSADQCSAPASRPATRRHSFLLGIGLALLPAAAMAIDTLAPERPQGYTIPTVDISGETARQVVVAQGTESVYQGHVHTLLMPDGKTIFAVWTYNHGGTCGPMKKSCDGGLTWSELLPVPDNWKTVHNCPTIHRLTDPQGKTRLVVFACGKGGMWRSFSEDDGKTWSPMAFAGNPCGVPPTSVEPIEGGKVLLTWCHIGPGGKDCSPLNTLQAASHDGGLTWGEVKTVCILPGKDPSAYARRKSNFDKTIDGADPCEPACVRSPDGKQLLLLLRENRRRLNSLYCTSDDEGRTWSDPKELPAALTGDRHTPRYTQDGRLVVVMRDMAAQSPTKGHFVAWVGKYDDIVQGREGQYRVKLLHSYKGSDCGYPGLEVLPDGTLVATTYIKYRPGPEKNSVVAVRFKLRDIDAQARQPRP